MRHCQILLTALTLSVTALVSGWSTQVNAQDLQLAGRDRWVAVASSRDVDTAIGIAGLFAHQSSRVVVSNNGWYGVVFGPVRARNIRAFRDSYASWPQLPSDALLSRGTNYVATVWTPPEQPNLPQVKVSAAGTATLRAGALRVTVSAGGAGGRARIVGSLGAERLFNLPAPEDFYTEYGAGLKAVRLQSSTRYPQIVLTRFSGGAHCCTATWILSERPRGGWGITEAGELDSAGYAFEDVDLDGALELISVDNGFHYTFDSYAGGNPPLRIARFADGRLMDVSSSPEFVRRYRQELAGMEFLAKVSPELWKSNGFLAGWVATSARVGGFEEAWDRMLPLYDRNSTFGVLVCPEGRENCSSEQMVALRFPDGLAKVLQDLGYFDQPASAPSDTAAFYPSVDGEVTATKVGDTCWEETDCRFGQCDIAVRIDGPAARVLLETLKRKVSVDPRMSELGLQLYESRDGGLSCLDDASPFCDLRLNAAEATLMPVQLCE